MDWLRLMTPHRFGDTKEHVVALEKSRDDFEIDHDRVVFSTPFRRLQDKTQVIPLPESDFVHTRLTHSLEVSCVGRSLGKIAGEYVLQQHPELSKEMGVKSSHFGSIIAAASLAHDIGNPPFGHSGEKAIGEYFQNGRGQAFRERIADDRQWKDLTDFEGNANGFRILTHSANAPEGGLRLTYPTLAAFTKYPKASLPDHPDSSKASDKKFGFFQTEAPYFREIAETLGLGKKYGKEEPNWLRHPLAFLVEAADDICYSIIDFEDGVRLGLIPEETYKKYLLAIIGNEFDEERYKTIPSNTERYGYLRAKAIQQLIGDLARVFIENEAAILSGEYDTSLLKKSRFLDPVQTIKSLSSEKVYLARAVLEIEAAGFEVLGGLLDIFIHSVEAEGARPKKARQLLPEPFAAAEGKDLYERIIIICEYIAGLTDPGAIALYRKLKGIELPRL